MTVFLLTGATIGVVGTFLGVGIGLLLSLNIDTIRQLLQRLSGTALFSPAVYFLTQLPSKVDFFVVFPFVVIALLLSFLSTLYPSLKAAKLDPVEALRQ